MGQASAKVDWHGVSEHMRGGGFHAVSDSGSLVCSVGELEEGMSARGDSSGSLVQSVKASGVVAGGAVAHTEGLIKEVIP